MPCFRIRTGERSIVRAGARPGGRFLETDDPGEAVELRHDDGYPNRHGGVVVDWLMLVAAAAILGFLWNVSRDVRDLHRCMDRELRRLSDRVSTVEGRLSTMLAMMTRAHGVASAAAPVPAPHREGADGRTG